VSARQRAAMALVLLISLCVGRVAVAALPGHAHNDYLHDRPLLQALELGYCSIEVDVHLVDGELLVAHTLEETSPERTLQALYLRPLLRLLESSGAPCEQPSLLLLVDIKSEAEPSYRRLVAELELLADHLAGLQDGSLRSGAVTVVVSGNRARELMASQSTRPAFLDGRLRDLDEGDASPELMPLVSDSWSRHFLWRGEGPMSGAEQRRLQEWVSAAHSQGRRLRFWAVPHDPSLWRVLLQAGVDLVSVDDLEGFASFVAGVSGPDP
jgi:hypothetical protein